MSNKILFVAELRKRLDEILSLEGFQVTVVHTEIPETIEYRRQLESASNDDILQIHGNEAGGRIYGIAKAGKRFDLLTTIRLLDPDFSNLEISEQHVWCYNTEQELAETLDDIVLLVRTHLLDWFNQDSPLEELEPGSGLVNLSDEEIQLAINRNREAASRLKAEGKIADAEGYERIADAMERNERSRHDKPSEDAD